MTHSKKPKANPFTKDEIGLKRKFKGIFPVTKCHNPCDLLGIENTLDNFKRWPDLEVDDDNCLIINEREFVSPLACEKYQDYSLAFFGFHEYSSPQ